MARVEGGNGVHNKQRKEVSMTKKGEVLKRKHLKSKDEKVWEIVQKWYEPHRHDRSKRWIYRNKVNRIMPMGERSFYRSLARHRERLLKAKEEDEERID